MTQLHHEVELDWTKEIKMNFEDFEKIQSMSSLCFNNKVKRNRKELALKRLKEKQTSHSKMSQLNISDKT